MQHELSFLGPGDRRHDADPVAELIRHAGLSLADAFDLGRMERIDLLAALAMVPVADLDRPDDFGPASGRMGPVSVLHRNCR